MKTNLLSKVIKFAAFIIVLIFATSVLFPGIINKVVNPIPAETKPNVTVIVSGIQKLARLETASINVQPTIPETINQDSLWGTKKETIEFVAYGQVIAGIDFTNFYDSNINALDKINVEVIMPQAKIFNVIIDNNKSYVDNRTKGIFVFTQDKDLESKVRAKAEDACRQSALEAGIIDQANKNAQDIIKEFLISYGFKTVIFIEK